MEIDGSQVVDLSEYQPTIPYDDAIKLCEELDLLEITHHGEHDYARLTEKGRNVFAALMEFISHTADPKNMLKIS